MEVFQPAVVVPVDQDHVGGNVAVLLEDPVLQGKKFPVPPPADLPPNQWEQFPNIWNQPMVPVPVPCPSVPPFQPSMIPPAVGLSPPGLPDHTNPFSIFPRNPRTQIHKQSPDRRRRHKVALRWYHW